MSKSENQNSSTQTWLYRENVRNGQLFDTSEVPNLKKKGWVDDSAMFGRWTGRGWYWFCYKTRILIGTFWLKQWKWIIAVIVMPICLLILSKAL